MKNYTFEHVSDNENKLINEKLVKLNKLDINGIITKKEKQYMYLMFLQKLNPEIVFNVYTNTEL